DILPSELETIRGKSLGSHRPVNVILDPDTAHPRLILSEDQKSVKWGDTILPLSQVPRRIQVCLDCEWGQVTFFNADNKAPIFTFPLASVPGERIYPWLWVGAGSELRLCP
ncbi:unnamed protein product, partial [Lepidochelys kempii]